MNDESRNGQGGVGTKDPPAGDDGLRYRDGERIAPEQGNLPGTEAAITLEQEIALEIVVACEAAERVKEKIEKASERLRSLMKQQGLEYVSVRDHIGDVHRFWLEAKESMKHKKF